MKSLELIQAIEEYNPFCEKITYSTLFAMMLRPEGKFKANFLNVGNAGFGKTRSTTELQEILKIPNTVVINGYVTPFRLFKTLVEHPNDLIILDEMERTLENPQAQFILRSALYGGEVCWQSKTNAETYKFNGCLVANLNKLPTKNISSSALFDRCFINKLELNNLQIAEKIRHTRTYDINKFKPAVRIIKKRILNARFKGLLELSENEENEIYEFINDKIINSIEPASVRAIQKTKLVFRCVKTLFEGFDEKTKRLAFTLAEPQIFQKNQIDEIINLANLLKNEKKEINYKLLVGEVSKLKGVSERQARRIINSKPEFIRKNRKLIILK